MFILCKLVKLVRGQFIILVIKPLKIFSGFITLTFRGKWIFTMAIFILDLPILTVND